VYVHVVSWADRQLAIPALGARVRRAYLLEGGQPVSFVESDAGVTLTLPARDPEAYDRVVVLVVSGAARHSHQPAHRSRRRTLLHLRSPS
jgi:hypothetical protein